MIVPTDLSYSALTLFASVLFCSLDSAVRIPDVDVRDLPETAGFSMVAGDFLEVGFDSLGGFLFFRPYCRVVSFWSVFGFVSLGD